VTRIWFDDEIADSEQHVSVWEKPD